MKSLQLEPESLADISFDFGPGYYERLSMLKVINKDLKIIASITMPPEKHSEGHLNLFADNVIGYLKDKKFDGLRIQTLI
jgi:hypothetical protein